jgi:hypothetical protein
MADITVCGAVQPYNAVLGGKLVAMLSASPEVVQAYHEDLGPRGWPSTRIGTVAERMRGPQGVPILDRRHRLNNYPQCFIGHEAVGWLRTAEALTRDEAIELGQILVERGLIHHVLDEHGFRDGNFFYRFYADECRQTA